MSENWYGLVAITGMGLVTPVGLYTDAAVAAMRAGVSRLRELPYLKIEVDEGEYAPVIGAEVPVVPAGRRGVDRLSRLLIHSLREAITGSGLENAAVELFLGTAGDKPAGRVLSQNLPLQDAMLETLPDNFVIKKVTMLQSGRAAALQAVRMAAQALSGGQVDVAIVGGVDSWTQPRSLLWLQEKKRLREFPRRTGILPGEAAGFLVLESMTHAQARGARVHAILTAAAGSTEETIYGQPGNANALSEAIAVASQGIEDTHALVISDFNGERYRAHEWMLAMPKGMWRYQTLRHWHPAEYIGDSGAASGIVTTAWAAQALQNGYARTPHVLVWGASDEGAREAIIIGESVEGAACRLQ